MEQDEVIVYTRERQIDRHQKHMTLGIFCWKEPQDGTIPLLASDKITNYVKHRLVATALPLETQGIQQTASMTATLMDVNAAASAEATRSKWWVVQRTY